MSPVDQSYAYCRNVARTQARNFYYSFVLLSKPQRDAMCAIYAFMRYCDDLSDDPALASARTMEQWRSELDGALTGEFGPHPCWPAFHDTVRRYGIPREYFHAMIDGVSSDLAPRQVQTFDQLYGYCYQVASVVGLTIVHIFGFDSPRALELAEKCGIAFQMTNILRDVKEDADRGRIYLPREDLEHFGVASPLRPSPELHKLMEFEAQRARMFYREAEPLVGMVHHGSRASLWALIEIYRRLLERIIASGYDVHTRRISLPGWEKASIVVQAYFKRSNVASHPG